MVKTTFFFFMIGLIFFHFGCHSSEKAAVKVEVKDTCFYKTETIEGKEITYLSMDFSHLEKPNSIEQFEQVWHLPPIQQGKTLSCWCFATTSLLESELKRLYGLEIKLSEMYTVYWEFVEKARRFVREKGNSLFAGGSEPNAVIERMKQYGAVRASDYSGLLSGKTEHDHTQMFEEMKNYLDDCQRRNFWDEEKIISEIKKILNKYMGEPPATIRVDGQIITPKEYVDNILRLPLDDYVAIMSFKYLPFYTKGEFKVPDNWWHSQDYYNLPLDEFYQAILESIKKGYSLAISVDFSEPGNSGEFNVAVVPTFDLPYDYIDQDSREFRFANSSTTDDHVLHLVGYMETPKNTWFLMKDSWWTAYIGPIKGYFFYRDDYIKLKALAFLVHREAVTPWLIKFQE